MHVASPAWISVSMYHVMTSPLEGWTYGFFWTLIEEEFRYTRFWVTLPHLTVYLTFFVCVTLQQLTAHCLRNSRNGNSSKGTIFTVYVTLLIYVMLLLVRAWCLLPSSINGHSIKKIFFSFQRKYKQILQLQNFLLWKVNPSW